MNSTPIWTLPKNERERILLWRKKLKAEIGEHVDRVSRLQKEIEFVKFHQKQFEIQLTLLEEQIKFD